MAKAESPNRRRAIEILPPESGPPPIDVTESMVREGVAFLEHHRESLDGESLVARLFETMMAAAPIERTLTLEQVLRQLHESEIKAGFSIIIEGQTFYDSSMNMKLWIGDPLGDIKAEITFQRNCVPGRWPDEAAMVRWLHETALRIHPESSYAQRHGHRSPERTAHAAHR
ncbi:MAG: hypothetical protein ACXWLB_07665 [Reyranella sp.]